MAARVRRCTPEDAAAVARLIEATIDVSYAAAYSPAINDFFKGFHEVGAVGARIAAGHVLAIEDGGEIVATGAATENRIFGMFVRPDRQGRGFGRMIMEALETHVREAGHADAVLSMSAPSETFYLARGYVPFEEKSRAVAPGETLVFRDARKVL